MVFLPGKLFTVSYSAVYTLKTDHRNKMVERCLALLVLLMLTGCPALPGVLYRIDVQQGNVVTEEMLEKLKPGMTKSQALFVLGSPLIVDPFRDNRWDYVYLFREKGDLVEQKRITLFFDQDNLTKIEDYQTTKHTPKPEPVAVKSVEKETAPLAKEIVLKENKVKPSEKKKRMDDDDDDNCDVPSSVSIRP